MTLHLPIRGVNLLRPGAALFCLLAPLSVHCNLSAQDQDVAEATRQQHAHKSQQPAAPRHVYTDEDLKRPLILTPEDKKLAEAHRKELPARAAKNPAAIDATNPTPESLGEVARRYRKEKAAREAQAWRQRKRLLRFKLNCPPAPLRSQSARLPRRVRLRLHRDRWLSNRRRRQRTPTCSAVSLSPFSPRPTMPSSASPVPSVNPSTLVPSREFQQLQVRPGESLWRIARRYLGDGARWQELLALNPSLATHPDSLAAGSTVIVPAAAASKTVHGSPPVITVQAGDTLWALARVHFGRGSDWPRLAQANPQISDYLHLQVGSQLQLPPQ